MLHGFNRFFCPVFFFAALLLPGQAAAKLNFGFTSAVKSTVKGLQKKAAEETAAATAPAVAVSTYGFVWARQRGSAAVDIARGLAIDAAGNIYVAGHTRGGLDGNINPSVFETDLFLVKYNSAGQWQWTRQLNSENAFLSHNDSAQSVAVDTSGNIFIFGMTTGDLDGNVQQGNTDVFLMKYSAAGVRQWTRQYGTGGVEMGYGMAIDAAGNIYVTGQTDMGLDGNVNAGGRDVFLLKYNAAGVRQWTQQLGSALDDEGYGVALDTSANVYVTGITLGGLDGNISAGMRDVFLIKYDTSGAKQWTRQFGSDNHEFGYNVAVDLAGNAYLTGTTGNAFDGQTLVGGGWNYFLVKYNSAGAKQWTKLDGALNSANGQSVATDAAGNVYVTGEASGDLHGNANAGAYDVLLAKYNSAGTKLWDKLHGTTEDDYSYGIALDAAGNIYSAGYTKGSFSGSSNAGVEDLSLIKYVP